MSSLDNVVDSMEIVQRYLYKIVCPITMIIGTISCLMNLLVFTQKSLRKNPCSVYFIAYNLANLFFIYTLYLSLTLLLGYNIDNSAKNIFLCRFRLYVTILLNCLSPFYLILASIDRVLVTSSNTRTRQRSNIRFAYKSILIGTLFWSLCHVHVIIFATHMKLPSKTVICYFQKGVYLSFLGYYTFLKEFVSVFLMIILGLWAIKNLRSIGLTRIPSRTREIRNGIRRNCHSNRSKDRQLMYMVLAETAIYALFSFLYAIVLLYQQITNFDKTLTEKKIEITIIGYCFYLMGIPYCTSFYINLFISKTFRNEVFKIFSRKYLNRNK